MLIFVSSLQLVFLNFFLNIPQKIVLWLDTLTIYEYFAICGLVLFSDVVYYLHHMFISVA